MGRQRSADWLAGGLAVAVTVTAIATLIAGGGGCELLVGDTIPAFTCDPGAANCPSDFVCVPRTHQCVARSSTCTPGASPGCSAGSVCDAETLRCTPAAPGMDDASDRGDATSSSGDATSDAPLMAADGSGPGDGPAADREGSPLDASSDVAGACRGIKCSCSRNADCDSGICAGQLTETTPLSMAIGSFCTQPCCTSADCPGTTVCFGTGGGGDYCVAPAWIGRGVEVGAGRGGATCTGDGDCRSGLCATTTSTCADTCCSSAQQSSECALGTVCRFAAFPGKSFDTHETAWCGPAIGMAAAGSPCAVDGTCQSGKCGSFTRCEAVCRSSADCGVQACSYGLGPTTLPTNKDIVAGCVNITGNTANGSACSSNADCQSGFCDGMHCTDVCVTDADCKSGLRCVPVVVQVQGSYSVLCCES